ncbi:AbrB/MazE/SpoVT family DNA-binding domain-containing protein [Sphingobium sp. Ant17]|jgi:antitoxin PrlF|uniref:AbrB/MazE/SpoVT family DNA-binding domain-containing protein n=1 Tax=Sphingobium sp. Ant17 TaxID=1461752 RepID=UPI00045153DD|nr:AbrB family transcriptional regulator [Sphingobium sp. Ant17]EXS69302.1 AbrB family transcriptional regulator [Sphingobium sp. Ant17]OHD01643.1 MAG: AbrB family transcriptional regulator [Sphingomonadales bacterium GWF1_63_6]|tara:strand:- start:2319 stop:2612 length:294 start_codon:yes stop_codon:yes gene_type:complete
MNAPTKIETGTMTSKGQILIPKAMRDAVGLKPGWPYKVAINAEGQVVVAPLGFGPEDSEERVRRMREGLMAIAGKYPNPDGMSTDQYMRELRGDYEP